MSFERDDDFGSFSYGKSSMNSGANPGAVPNRNPIPNSDRNMNPAVNSDPGQQRIPQQDARLTAYRPEPYETPGYASQQRTYAPAGSAYPRMNSMNSGYGSGADTPHHDAEGNTDNLSSDIKAGDARQRKDDAAQGKAGRKAKKESSGTGKRVLLTAALALVFGVIASGTFIGMNKLFGDKKEDTTETSTVQMASNDPISAQNLASGDGTTATISYDVAELVKKAQPSTVSITTTVTKSYQYYFQQFEREATGAGSGIIIGQTDDLLYIATNYHVIEDAREIKVGFFDGALVKAKVTGYDSNADVAVVQVNKTDIPQATADVITVAAVGDSDKLQVGEPCVAIGNAMGYGQSVTVGYISALNRAISGSDGTYIQTDAAINPGNSGGALFNAQGEVIGINSIKYVDSKVEGMGFSIPINKAMRIVESLITNGTKGKIYIGIGGADITSEYNAVYGFPMGVYIKNMTSGGPAEAAGLHTGDIITSVDGKSISTMEELIDYLQKYKAGDRVEVEFYRTDSMGKYSKMTITVTLAEE